MAIIRPTNPKRDSSQEDQDEVPFVPAYDLLEEQERRLSGGEIVALALTLWLEVSGGEEVMSFWRAQARIEGISQRI